MSPTPRTFALLIDPAVIYGLNDADTTDAVTALNLINATFKQAGYKAATCPNLNPAESQTDLLWEEITALSAEVIWVEAHGSASQGILPLPLETVAGMPPETRIGRWAGRLHTNLLVFGSCNTGLSPLVPLLPYLVGQPTVVVFSDSYVTWEDGQDYPKLINAWLKTATNADLNVQAAELSKAMPRVFRAVVITPLWNLVEGTLR